MKSQNEAYRVANSQAYQAGLLPHEIPSAEKLIRPIHLPIGIQPLGICSLGGNLFAMADYFGPAIYIGEYKTDESERVDHLLQTEVIRFVRNGEEKHRLFPPWTTPFGANRAQTVNQGPDGTLIISANASREFFVLEREEDGWSVIRQFSLPQPKKEEDFRFVHSAYCFGKQIAITSSGGNLNEPWSIETYAPKKDGFIRGANYNTGMSYAFGVCLGPDTGSRGTWYITDSRTNGKPGIYRDEDLVMPDITGNGLCFLDDGSLLVSRYGQEYHPPPAEPGVMSFGGDPGCLIYIHHSLIDAALKRLSA